MDRELSRSTDGGGVWCGVRGFPLTLTTQTDFLGLTFFSDNLLLHTLVKMLHRFSVNRQGPTAAGAKGCVVGVF